jgi:2,4-dienoyl-CoA reductase-like NADH-dependent reductase (Old Yellow Enzyme family)
MKSRTGRSFVVRLCDPLTVGGLMLKNWIVMPLTANDLASTTGEVTEALIAHYTH